LASQQQQIDNDVTINPILDFTGTSEQSPSDWNDFNDMSLPLQSGNNASFAEEEEEEVEAPFSTFVPSTDAPPVPVTATSLTATPARLASLWVPLTTTPPLTEAATSLPTMPQQLHELTGFVPAEL
jgi:hypothetical protein